MISEMLLKFGSSPGVPALATSVAPVTLFVGPNNSGKSKVLTEIERFSTDGQVSTNDLILERLIFEPLPTEEAQTAVAGITVDPNQNESQTPGHIFLESVRGGRMHVETNQLLQALQNPSSGVGIVASWFLRHLILRLDGPNRVGLIGQQKAGDLQARPKNALQSLFKDEVKRKEVRRIVYEAFGSYFVIDPTNLGNLRIRLSPRPPVNDMEERNIHAEGVAFHKLGTSIDVTSDGVKAFIGIIMALIAGDPRVLLIDEPEAFLHPSLATKLGYEVSRAAVGSARSLSWGAFNPAHQ